MKRLNIMDNGIKKIILYTIFIAILALFTGYIVLFTSLISQFHKILLCILILFLLTIVILLLVLFEKLKRISNNTNKPAAVPTQQPIQNISIQASVPLPHPVTDVKQEELKEETILSNIGEGLVIINKLGKIITFNKAAQALLGWSQDEAIGKNFADVVKVDFENKIEVKKQTLGHQSSLHFIRKDGSRFPAAITTSSYVQGDNILGTITLFRDITAERNNDKMKNEFISLASHQLRTPLSAIKWYSNMLINGDAGKLQTEQQEYAESIYTSTERMIALVNSLLNITRIESGRIMVVPEPTDLKKMLTEIIDEVKIRYGNKNQNYSVSLDDSIPNVNVDPHLIRQVYVNLLTNAAKYTPEKGTIKIKLSKK